MKSLFAMLALLVAGSAQATPPTLAPLGRAYAEKHGLPVRVVKSDLGVREVERHFVPVLPSTREDFIDTFRVEKGAVTWIAGADKVHAEISLRPGNKLLWTMARPSLAPVVHPSSQNGYYLTLAMSEAQLGYWEHTIDQHSGPGRALHEGLRTYKEPGVERAHGGCMWWLVHAQLSGGLNLATAMGVRRAKGPEALAPRLFHAGNELVGPIGIPVDSIEKFDAMSDQMLMGPEPAGGAAEQVKE